jgi:hypothetical protein
MKQLGNPDEIDWFLFALVILQAYWSFKQYRHSQDAGRII